MKMMNDETVKRNSSQAFDSTSTEIKPYSRESENVWGQGYKAVTCLQRTRAELLISKWNIKRCHCSEQTSFRKSRESNSLAGFSQSLAGLLTAFRDRIPMVRKAC